MRSCFATSPETCRLGRTRTPSFESVEGAEAWLADHVAYEGTTGQDSSAAPVAPQVTTGAGRTLYTKDAFCAVDHIKGTSVDRLVYEADCPQGNAADLQHGTRTCFDRHELGKHVTVTEPDDICTTQAAYMTDDGRAGSVINEWQ